MALKICVAQLNFLVGDMPGNAQKIIAAARTAYEQGARLVLTPELSICGYAAEDLDGSWRPFRAVGCSACNSGYKGRVGIYQVMPITEAIQQIILRDGSALDIAAQSELEGVRSLRQSGLLKVKQGLTSLEEVLAVTNE